MLLSDDHRAVQDAVRSEARQWAASLQPLLEANKKAAENAATTKAGN